MPDSIISITYKKVNKLPQRQGYLKKVIKNIIKRRKQVAHTYMTVSNNLTPAVKDFVYFTNRECFHILSKLQQPLNILDIGCGNGQYSYYFDKFIRFKTDYSGCEITNSLVKLCKKNNPDVRFFVSKMDNIKAENNSYDISLCSGVLQYTLNDWQKSLLEVKRVTTGYIMLLRLPVTKFHRSCYVQQTVIYSDYSDDYYFLLLNRKSLEREFKRLGMKIVKRDYSSEVINVQGVDEDIMLMQYLLAR